MKREKVRDDKQKKDRGSRGSSSGRGSRGNSSGSNGSGSSGSSIRSRKKKQAGRVYRVMVVVCELLVVVGILAGIQAVAMWHYGGRFLPGTTVNGLDVAGMTAEEVQWLLVDNMEDYSLTLIERYDATETISGSSIGYTLVFDGTIEEAIAEQKTWQWFLYVFGNKTDEITVDSLFTYNEGSLETAIDGLFCMDTENAILPQDAYISGYDAEAGGVTIEAEVMGNLVDEEILKATIRTAVATMQRELDLEEAGCYIDPQVTSADPELLAEAEYKNTWLSTEIIYEFGENTEVVNGEVLFDWLTFEEDGSVTLDEDAVRAFVRNLAYNYNTIYANREFETSYGVTVTVSGGDYGWWMNETTETSELAEQILNCESGIREPVWYSTAAVLGVGAAGDYGDTYVEVNLTAQHLFYYKDGELVIESDFVSGKNDATPTGTYGILYRERYATLNGENYSSPVSYWMPFYNGVGLHDASWRTSFGGTIYKTSGSHGCLNLPIKVAKTIYENISAGTAVIVYKLDGTESTTTSSQSYEDIASAIVDALDEIAAAGDITSANYNSMSKKIKWAQAAYSSLSSSAKSLVTNINLLNEAVAALEAYTQ